MFVGPDNGLAFGSPAVPEKYAHIDELTPLLERGQSLVVYQHANRTADVEQQATRLLQRLSKSLPIEPFAAVIARRGTVRMFVLLPQPRHRDSFAAAIRCIETSPWATHLRPIHHRQHAARRIQRTSASRRRR